MFPPSNKRIFSDAALHFLLTVIFSALIYSRTRNFTFVAVFILVGYLIDLDHLFDYFLFSGKKFNLKDLFKLIFIKSGRVYYLLHSWELTFIVCALGITSKSPILLVAGISLTVHLAIDNLQRRNPLFYFLTYRIINKFDANTLMPEYRKDR